MFEKSKKINLEKKIMRAYDKNEVSSTARLISRYMNLSAQYIVVETIRIGKDKILSPLYFASSNSYNKNGFLSNFLSTGANYSEQIFVSHEGSPSYGNEVKISPIGLALYCQIYIKNKTYYNPYLYPYLYFANTLIEKGCQPMLTDLYYAVECDHFKSAQYIIEKCQSEINYAKKNGYFYDEHNKLHGLLGLAARNNDFELVKLLLDEIYNDNSKMVNLKTELCSWALYTAIQNDNLEMVKLLVEHGADVNYNGHEYHTPIFDAIAYNRVNIAKYLIDKGAQIERHYGHGWFYSQGNTPLGLAWDKAYFNMVKLLVENGATLISSESKPQLEEFLKKHNLTLKENNEESKPKKAEPAKENKSTNDRVL